MADVWVSSDGVGIMPDTWYFLSLNDDGALKIEEIPEPDYACGGVEVEDGSARRTEIMKRIALDTEMFSSSPRFTDEQHAPIEPDLMSATRDIARGS